jgi:hypothetical protein
MRAVIAALAAPLMASAQPAQSRAACSSKIPATLPPDTSWSGGSSHSSAPICSSSTLS